MKASFIVECDRCNNEFGGLLYGSKEVIGKMERAINFKFSHGYCHICDYGKLEITFNRNIGEIERLIERENDV